MRDTSNRPTITARNLLMGVAILALLTIALLIDASRDARAVEDPATSSHNGQHTSDNWDFERGNLTGWHTRSRGSGAWYAYADGTTAPNPDETDPDVAFNVPAPPQGRYAAVTDMTAPGARILYRDVKLHGRVRLTFTVYYDNAGQFASPPTLAFDGCQANQQLRVELIDADAPPDTTAAKHVLATIFQTAPGDLAKLAPKTVTADLSQWTGRRVRIRFAQVDNRGPLRAGVDDIQLQQIGN